MTTWRQRPLWWKVLFALLTTFGLFLFYLGVISLLVEGVGIFELALWRDSLTNILFLLYLPTLLLSFKRPHFAQMVFVLIAGLQLLLGFIELGIPNLIGDAFAEVPNHFSFVERGFLLTPAILGFFLLRQRKPRTLSL